MIKKEYTEWTGIETYMRERSEMLMNGYEVVDSLIQQKDVFIIGWVSYIRGYIIYAKK